MKSESKDKGMFIRLSESERQRIRILADTAGLKTTEWIRSRALSTDAESDMHIQELKEVIQLLQVELKETMDVSQKSMESIVSDLRIFNQSLPQGGMTQNEEHKTENEDENNLSEAVSAGVC